MSDDNDAMRWSRIEVTGDDAETYLQGQLTQDLTTVGTTGRWSLILAPDSVVIASCFVTTSPEGFSLVVENDGADAVLTRLRRFLLRSRCSFSVIEDVDGPFTTTGDRVDAGWPGVPEFAKALPPHSFGSALVRDTVSFTKGCYTGQELVGRLDARGANLPWRLVRVSGPAAEWTDAPLLAYGPAGPQGVTTAVRRGDRIEGLAIVHRSLLQALDSFAPNQLTVSAID